MSAWRRSSLVLLVLALFTWGPVPGYAEAQKGRSKSTATTSSKKSGEKKAKSADSEKTVHVREYTRKDGTKVKEHKRRPPGAGSDKEDKGKGQ